MKKIYPMIALSFITALAISLVPVTASVLAATPNSKSRDQVCAGIGLTDGSNGCGDQGAAFSNALTTIINILSSVIGVIAVLMIIVAGFRFVASSGDSNKVGAAKNTIVYALIGLAIVVLAQVIVHFVITEVH